MSLVFPPNEAARQQELNSYQILDTPPDSAFDNLVSLAAEICEAPISMISLVDRNRQWFKSRVGLDSAETPREQSFCAHAIVGDQPLMVVGDATQDERFAANPLVTGAPYIRFYAGAPLRSNGQGLGTLCVIDRTPRTLRPSQERALGMLAEQANQLMELHRQRAKADSQSRFLNTVMETLAEGVIVRDKHRRLITHNTMASVLLGTELKKIVGQTFSMLHFKPVRPDGVPLPTEDLPSYRALATGEPQRNTVFGITRPDGKEMWLESNVSVLHDPVHGECAVISFRDVSDSKTLEQQFQRAAITDVVTGLPNRAALLAQISRSISAAGRYKHPMSVCIAALDDVPSLQAKRLGDSALRHFAVMFRSVLRNEDTVGRFGNDELAALFPYVDAAHAVTSIERVRATLQQEKLHGEQGEEVSLSITCGLADWTPGMSADDLVQKAAQALAAARLPGANKLSVATH